MALLKDYLARKLIHENHPTRDDAACLNTCQTKRPCGICRSVCPLGVFDRDEPNWDLCDGCGACAAACPQRCIRPSALLSAAALETCGRVRGDVVLSCTAQDAACDWALPCLAALPWEVPAFFALGGTVTLVCGGCLGCPRRECFEAWKTELGKAYAFLESGGYSVRLTLWTEGTPPPAKVLSRRDAFGTLFSKSRSTLAGLLPEDKDLAPDGTLFRQMLVHRLRRLEPPAAFSWSVPAFEDGCTACGVCARLCPSKALHRVDGAPEGDGPRSWYMAVIPWRCTDCGLCAGACPAGALAAPSPRSLTDPAKPLVHPVRALPCPRCGEPTAGGAECPRCRAERAPVNEFML